MSQFQIKISESVYQVNLTNSEVKINGHEFPFKIYSEHSNSFFLTKDNKNYQVDLLKVNYEEKRAQIRVNGNKYECEIQDEFDLLLKSMGFDQSKSAKIKELRAPMPGLVIDIAVQEGAEIKKGDTLLILEAMKMENVIKAPGDAIVKKIHVVKGNAVEKNQVLISF